MCFKHISKNHQHSTHRLIRCLMVYLTFRRHLIQLTLWHELSSYFQKNCTQYLILIFVNFLPKNKENSPWKITEFDIDADQMIGIEKLSECWKLKKILFTSIYDLLFAKFVIVSELVTWKQSWRNGLYHLMINILVKQSKLHHKQFPYASISWLVAH